MMKVGETMDMDASLGEILRGAERGVTGASGAAFPSISRGAAVRSVCQVVRCLLASFAALALEAQTIHVTRVGPQELSLEVKSYLAGAVLRSTDAMTWTPWYTFGKHFGEIPVRSEHPMEFFQVVEGGFTPPTNFVWISPGRFLMGSPENEAGRSYTEYQHPVTVSQGFWMCRTEVTRAQFEEIMGSFPAETTSAPDAALNMVTWREACDYCAALTQRERSLGNIDGSLRYRLPSEEEWEYACRASSKTRYFYGDDPDCSILPRYAWFRENSGGRPHPPRLKFPNPWGLYDILGNVFEWTLDEYNAYPGNREYIDHYAHIFRGGSHYCPAWVLRSAERHPDGKGDRSPLIGFRVVLGAEPSFVNKIEPMTALQWSVEWNEDHTQATVCVRAEAYGSPIELFRGVWPQLASGVNSVSYTSCEAMTFTAAAREYNHLSTSSTFTLSQAAPPGVEVRDGMVYVTPSEQDTMTEFRTGNDDWQPWIEPFAYSPQETVEARSQHPQKLSSQVVRYPL